MNHGGPGHREVAGAHTTGEDAMQKAERHLGAGPGEGAEFPHTGSVVVVRHVAEAA